MVGLAFPLGDRTFREVRLHPDDRVNASLVPGVVPIHRRIHHAMVGHCHVLNPKFLGPVDVLVDPAHAIEEGELGMQVQMGELGHECLRTLPSLSRDAGRRSGNEDRPLPLTATGGAVGMAGIIHHRWVPVTTGGSLMRSRQHTNLPQAATTASVPAGSLSRGHAAPVPPAAAGPAASSRDTPPAPGRSAAVRALP